MQVFWDFFSTFASKMDKNIVSTSDVIKQMRLPLIILVTYAHSYGGITEGYSLTASVWSTLEVLKLLISQTLVKAAVPTFFVISGYLFFANVEPWNRQTYWQKIKRRIRTLLIPYLLWNLLMSFKLKSLSLNTFWAFWSEAGQQTDWLGQTHLMTAPANMPLWFLRDLMVVSLLTPIIYTGIRRLGYWLMVPLTLLYLSGVSPFMPGLSAYAIYFFTLGAFLGIRKLDAVETCLRFEWVAYILTVGFALAMMLTYGYAVFSSMMLCFRLVSVAALFCLFNRIVSCTRKQNTTSKGKQLASPSYFIYLAHFVFFFSFLDKAFFELFGTSETAQCVHYLLCPLLKAAILAAVYKVISYFWVFLTERVHTAFQKG